MSVSPIPVHLPPGSRAIMSNESSMVGVGQPAWSGGLEYVSVCLSWPYQYTCPPGSRSTGPAEAEEGECVRVRCS